MHRTGAGLWYLLTLSQKWHIWYPKSFPPPRQTHPEDPQFPGRAPHSGSGFIPAAVINYLIKKQFRGEWDCFSFCFRVSFHHFVETATSRPPSRAERNKLIRTTAQPACSTRTVQGLASRDGAAHFQAVMWRQAIKATKTIVHRHAWRSPWSPQPLLPQDSFPRWKSVSIWQLKFRYDQISFKIVCFYVYEYFACLLVYASQVCMIGTCSGQSWAFDILGLELTNVDAWNWTQVRWKDNQRC